ncbi:hypothetical protein Alches_10700 [Alicyclobacillus hesperidum subsp. aegles]|nr:hypothetical protein Alches_10700 [Alicyclobacillus hesperidum subsp. aegles]
MCAIGEMYRSKARFWKPISRPFLPKNTMYNASSWAYAAFVVLRGDAHDEKVAGVGWEAAFRSCDSQFREIS